MSGSIRITLASVSPQCFSMSRGPLPQVPHSSYRLLSQSPLVLRFDFFLLYLPASTESFRHTRLQILPPMYFNLPSSLTELEVLHFLFLPISHLPVTGKKTPSWTSNRSTYICKIYRHYLENLLIGNPSCHMQA